MLLLCCDWCNRLECETVVGGGCPGRATPSLTQRAPPSTLHCIGLGTARRCMKHSSLKRCTLGLCSCELDFTPSNDQDYEWGARLAYCLDCEAMPVAVYAASQFEPSKSTFVTVAMVVGSTQATVTAQQSGLDRGE
jgi:hypothetical protein